MLGRIEPMSEYNTHAKTQVPKYISSVISLGPPDPTTIGAEFMHALSLPLITSSNSDRPLQCPHIYPNFNPTYLARKCT
jgi:hypothetical protein